MNPIISVLIPVHNRQEMITRCLESVLGQTIDDIEIIVVDDGSTDATRTAVRGIQDRRIKIIELPTNCGVSIARNVGLACAQAPYVAMIDSDDYSEPKRFEYQLVHLENNQEVAAVGTQCIKHLSKKKIYQKHPIEDNTIKANLFFSNGSAMINSSTMVRRKFIQNNNLNFPSVYRGEDHEFWLSMMLAGAKFSNLENHLHHYRRHESNLTSNKLLFKYNLRRKHLFQKKFLLESFFALTSREAAAISLTALSQELPSLAIIKEAKQGLEKIHSERVNKYSIDIASLLTPIENLITKATLRS